MLSFTEMETVCKDTKLLPHLLGMEEQHGLVKIVTMFDKMLVCFEDGTSFETQKHEVSFSDYTKVFFDAIGKEVITSYPARSLVKVTEIPSEWVSKAVVSCLGKLSIEFNNSRAKRQLSISNEVDVDYKFLVIKDNKKSQGKHQTYSSYYEKGEDLTKYVVEAVNLFLDTNPNISIMSYK